MDERVVGGRRQGGLARHSCSACVIQQNVMPVFVQREAWREKSHSLLVDHVLTSSICLVALGFAGFFQSSVGGVNSFFASWRRICSEIRSDR